MRSRGTARAVRTRAAAVTPETMFPLPQTAVEAVKQAAEAIKRGLDANLTRQQVSILLPVEQRRSNYMFTESMEYPENAATIYATAGEMAGALLQALGETAAVVAQRIDDDGIDGEQVGVYTTASKKVLVVVTPTADVLKKLRKLEENKGSTMILMNPQWRTKGNLLSDFGIGPWRKKNEEFVALFASTYSLTEQRIGAASTLDPATGDYMGNGGVVRLLNVYPAKHQVFSIGKDGSSECIMVQAELPTYKDLEGGVRNSKTSLKTTRGGEGLTSEEERLQVGGNDEIIDFSLKSGSEIMVAVKAGLVKPTDVDRMDKTALRAALGAWGIPTSGKVELLRQRLAAKIANPNK